MSASPASTALLTAPADFDLARELQTRLNYERLPEAARSLQDFRLQRMETLLSELGNPQLAVPTVHLAGTKGKGSTATMVAQIVAAAGLRAGLFTSPHIQRFEERFTVNGRTATPGELWLLWNRLQPVLERLDNISPPGPTFFEIMTALGWLHFQQQRVELAVMEVGLGGRLDSTNVCAPLVTAITSISRDHMRLLGDTLEAIAREKAGIIKPGIPVICGQLDAGPARVIAEVAATCQSPLLRLGTEFRLQTDPPGAPPFAEPPCYSFDYHQPDLQLRNVALAMPGEHQTRNAAVALAICAELRRRGIDLPDDSLRQGLLTARCPLRVDVRQRQPLVILDVAHNPASIAALCQTLADVRARKRIVVFGASRDKEVRVLLDLLRPRFDHFVLTKFVNNPRAVELPELEQLAQDLNLPQVQLAPDPAAALEIAQRLAGPDDLICVTGSFFLAAEAGAALDSPLQT